jgi:hypothetical protein
MRDERRNDEEHEIKVKRQRTRDERGGKRDERRDEDVGNVRRGGGSFYFSVIYFVSSILLYLSR